MDPVAARALAQQLMADHGLEGWTVVLDTAVRRAGVCRFADRTIGLSAPLTRLHDETQVRETILHEIAHALVGPRHGHDRVWRETARRLGASGERCLPADTPAPEAPWVGTCPAGHTSTRHRRPERVMTCARCSRTFDPAHVLTWHHRGRPAQHHPNYLAELAALQEGRVWRLVGPGGRIRITAPGEWAGRDGVVVGHGRTSYRVRVGRRTVSVWFAHAQPVD
ncbi:SprT-like domain-containing protein [Nocardioides sp.]|uniref:SprT-like domain-containing protein n=1 Tax=Nocardioides sp. TaxID=35761 RepID=UPI00351374A6